MIKRILVLFCTICSLHLNAQTGIGTTTPVNKFQIETGVADPLTSGTGLNGNLRLGVPGANQVLDFGMGTTYAWIQARSKNGYGTNYTLALNPNGGSIGVGTNNPQTLLHVKNGYLRLENTTASYFDFFQNDATVDKKFRRIGSLNGDMVFDKVNDAYSSGTEQMRITSSGNLGIGTNAPAEKLEVSGNVKATNFIGSGSQLTDIVVKVKNTWDVPNGTYNYTISLSPGTYILWVNGNIPNGIITFNGLVTITNTNVPVAGNYNAWVYTGGGSPLDFTTLPDQFTGTNGIIRSSTYSGSNSNNFVFGIKNTTSTTYQVDWGYLKLN